MTALDHDTPAMRGWKKRLASLSVPAVVPGTPLASAVAALRRSLPVLLGIRPRPGRAARGLSLEVVTGTPGSYTLTAFAEGIRLTAADEPGLLAGTLRLLEEIRRGRDPEGLAIKEPPPSR